MSKIDAAPKPLSVIVPHALFEDLSEHARSDDLTLSQLVRRALRAYLEEMNK